MSLRREFVLVWFGVAASMGAAYRTTNFQVDAPTPQIAQQVGQLAEQYRREKALQWIGQEMPPWSEPCPVHVKVTMTGAGGATSFVFDRGRVLGQDMQIQGALDRLLYSVLPHEVTHTVFAYYYRQPVPRWADEGGAVLSEDDEERDRHDKLCRQILNSGRAIPLRRLFSLADYPKGEVMSLYAEGYSVTSYLVSSSSRTAFLAFIAHAMQYGWDSAVQVHYRYRNVEDLEQAWLAHLRATKQRPPDQLVKNTRTPDTRTPDCNPTQQVIVRQTAPPVQPLDPQNGPIYRGANPDLDERRAPSPAGRPLYLPEYAAPSAAKPPSTFAPPTGWTPVPPAAASPQPNVRLGAPQFGSNPR
jgi:hypothetical protein